MKKKLRSILALLMAVLMVAAFTACGSNGSSSSSASGGKLQEVLDRGYLIVGTGSTNAPWHLRRQRQPLRFRRLHGQDRCQFPLRRSGSGQVRRAVL